MKHPDKKRNYKVWMPANCDIPPNVCRTPAGAAPLQEQNVKPGCLVCPLPPSLPLPPRGSSSLPRTQGQIKGKSKFPALWADPSCLPLYRKKKKITLCSPLVPGRTFLLKAWFWVSEAVRSSQITNLYHIPDCRMFSGWKREAAQRRVRHQFNTKFHSDAFKNGLLIKGTWLEINLANHTNW